MTPEPLLRPLESLLNRNIAGSSRARSLLTQVTGVPCHVAENAMNCVALGTGLALEHFDFFKKSLVQTV